LPAQGGASFLLYYRKAELVLGLESRISVRSWKLNLR